MKYLILTLCVLLTACSAGKPKQFICFNPFNPLQSLELSTDSPQVKEKELTLEAKDARGNVAVIPKSLCVEVRAVQ